MTTPQAKILTVSDGVHHGVREDTGGEGVAARLMAAGFDVVERRVTEDGRKSVAAALANTNEYIFIIQALHRFDHVHTCEELSDPYPLHANTPMCAFASCMKAPSTAFV